jgi:hypothetical protein
MNAGVGITGRAAGRAADTVISSALILTPGRPGVGAPSSGRRGGIAQLIGPSGSPNWNRVLNIFSAYMMMVVCNDR